MKRFLAIFLTLSSFVFIFYFITYLESLKKPGSQSFSDDKRAASALRYANSPTNKLIVLAKKKSVLSSTDTKAKQKLLSGIDISSSVLYRDLDILIEYVKSSDSLMVEIKNIDVDFSKQKAINYLKANGFTENGICNFPLVFYLNHKTAQEYGEKEKEFSPIPNFCK